MEIEFLSKTNLVSDIWEFRFSKPPAFTFEAGDYVDLGFPDTGAHWLSLASHPDEAELLFVVRIPKLPSIYKKRMSEMRRGDICITSPAIGNFNLPRVEKKILFVAFGIGITPYRAMIGKPDVSLDGWTSRAALVYAANHGEHIYETVIDSSGIDYLKQEKRIDFATLQSLVPDLEERIIYISGPEIVCQNLYAELLHAGIPRMQLKLEYFTGYR